MSFRAAGETKARPRHCGLQWGFRASLGALLMVWRAFTPLIRPQVARLPGVSQAFAKTASRPDARSFIGRQRRLTR
jgi:hypothetical protein